MTDLADGQPVAGLACHLYPYEGDVVTGSTDSDGVFTAPLPAGKEPWRSVQAVVGTADDPGWASTAWSQGINAWDFNLPADTFPQP